MNLEKLQSMVAGREPWREDFGEGMERRGADGMSWYDLSVNLNSVPCQTDTAIIVTAWQGQLKWLKPVLDSYRKSGAFVILAYDNPLYPWVPLNEHQILRSFPTAQHYIAANSVVMKHITYDSDKRNGWFWSMRYAQGVLRSFPQIRYVYHTNGDCLWERPEGLRDLKALLDAGDLISGQDTGGVIHTAAILWKAEAFHKAFDWMYEVMRVPVVGSHSPEVMLREAVSDLKLDLRRAPVQPLAPDGTVDVYCMHDQPSTFKDLVGFRNLFASYETAGNECREPTVGPYADLSQDCIYWGGEEKETICQFWKTGDRRYLYMWLDRWEDSDYNRLYTGLDYYSPVPVMHRDQDVAVYRRIPI